MLAIEITLLTGRYTATAFNDRRRGEWPPHPARLYSALVATCFESGGDNNELAALEWLEGLGFPLINASSCTEREAVTVFVPVNDCYTISNLDEDQALVDQARHALNASQSLKERDSLAKNLQKLEKKLADKILKVVAPVTKPTVGGAISATHVLPESRIRQPRSFPSVTPEVPVVTFAWPDIEPNLEQQRILDGLLARLVRLGHSSSLVSARLVDDPGQPTYVPDPEGGMLLRVTREGQLCALMRSYERHRETEPRVMPARFATYAKPVEPKALSFPCSCFSDSWLTFRRIDGPRLPQTSLVGLARIIRKVLLRYYPKPIPEVISGHQADGSTSERDHVAIVPLPLVASYQATGHLLGFAIVPPRDLSDPERANLGEALRSWEKENRNRDDEQDLPSLPVNLGNVGVWIVRRLDTESAARTLLEKTWCGPSRIWLSSSPVALDRNPGDLATRDQAKLARAIEEAKLTIRDSILRLGLPAPAEIEVMPHAPLPGSTKARAFRPFPSEPGRTRRVLTHAKIRFQEPVIGPILLGAGRYLGLGLFWPQTEESKPWRS